MGLRYRKSVKIGKGVKVNFGKTGASLTVGTRGLHHTVHTSGKRTNTVGIPGTGLSYVETSGGGKKQSSKSSGKRSNSVASAGGSQQLTATVQQQRDMEYAQNCEMVDDFNELIDQIRSIHEECSEQIDWAALRDKPAPFNIMYMGPREAQARKELESAKPSLLGRFVPAADKKRTQALEEAVDEAKRKDQEDYSEWESLSKLARQVLKGDIDSYFYVVSEMHPFDEILEYGSDFDIGTDVSDLIEVEFHAKTAKVVPNHVLSLTKTGKLSSKAMTKTMHFDIAQDYICSCVLRVAREMFALLPINTVVIHAVDTIKDSDGNESDDTVLSVLIHRDQLEGLNWGLIDPSDTLETFTCNMNFKKTQGLKPVPRVAF